MTNDEKRLHIARLTAELAATLEQHLDAVPDGWDTLELRELVADVAAESAVLRRLPFSGHELGRLANKARLAEYGRLARPILDHVGKTKGNA